MKKVIILTMVLLITLSCNFISNLQRNPIDTKYNVLVLNFASSSIGNKTIVPDITMEIDSYDIRGYGPSGAYFERLDWFSGNSLFINSIVSGIWIIEIDAKNSDGIIIGNGNTSADVIANSTTTADITVGPVEGDGTFTINITWVQDDFTDPTISAYVKKADETEIQLNDFTVVDNSASSVTTLSNGYYQLFLTISDGQNNAYLEDKVIRIIYAQNTIATLVVGDTGDIGLTITIVSEMDNPITIAFSGLIFLLEEGDNMTLTSITDPSPVDAYQWYLDGKALSGETASSITFGNDLLPGKHWIMLMVEKGSILSSNKLSFYVVEEPKILAKGHDKRIDVWWEHDPNFESADFIGYKIYRASDSDPTNFIWLNESLEGTRRINVYSDWINVNDITYHYKIVSKTNSTEYQLHDMVVNATTILETDEQFLDGIQEPIFRYFYDFGHPTSGLARERSPFEETCTTGGSGFGLMAIIVGVERGFIKRKFAADRIVKILNFLKNNTTRYHGVWPHWVNGDTGVTIQFLPGIYAGDLIETAFMVQGILTAHQYFDADDPIEVNLRSLANELWEDVEWDFYKGTGDNEWDMWWHWSPDLGFVWPGNFHIEGYHEGMIAYMLAMASPTHSIPIECYSNGWANGVNLGHEYYASSESWNTYYGIKQYLLPFKEQKMGMPLFWTHYSYLGFDPRGKNDGIIDPSVTYFDVFRNISLIDRAYCQSDGGYNAYSEHIWGLTASDDPWGYGVHSPHEDNGTITPTAFISAIPFVPEYSIPTMRYIYDTYTWQVWGEFGFKDAFNLEQNWFSNLYLAIDQGPNIVMIENYRSGLLWDLFMSHPDIQALMTQLDANGWTITQ